MEKKRRFYLVLALFALLVLALFVSTLVLFSGGPAFCYDPRPLLNPADSMLSVLAPAQTGFRIFHGCNLTGVDVTHLVDLDELFDLLSQTEIQHTGPNDWQGTSGADWVFWNMGSSYRDSLRGRTIAFWGTEGGMMARVDFGVRTFRLSNADEILAFLEQAIAEQ